jgi:hypothetical protein
MAIQTDKSVVDAYLAMKGIPLEEEVQVEEEVQEEEQVVTEARINTVVDFHIQLANVLRNQDLRLLQSIRRQTSQWMQMPDEAKAMERLINAVEVVVEDINGEYY